MGIHFCERTNKTNYGRTTWIDQSNKKTIFFLMNEKTNELKSFEQT